MTNAVGTLDLGDLNRIAGMQINKVSTLSPAFRRFLARNGGYKLGHAIDLMFEGELNEDDTSALCQAAIKLGIDLDAVVDIWKWIKLHQELAAAGLIVQDLNRNIRDLQAKHDSEIGELRRQHGIIVAKLEHRINVAIEQVANLGRQTDALRKQLEHVAEG